MLDESGLQRLFDQTPELSSYVIYGDTGYPCRGCVASPFRGAFVDQGRKAWNAAMSKSRISAEWIFGIATKLFQSVNFRPGQRSLQCPVGQQFSVMILLTNAHTCMYGGNQISRYFDQRPPTLSEYLQHACDETPVHGHARETIAVDQPCLSSSLR